MKIRELIEVAAQPTVIRLDQVENPDARWLTESFFLTEDIRRHLDSFHTLLGRDRGAGVFLIGAYGSGKSHFLAYLARKLRETPPEKRRPWVVPLSLLHFKAEQTLESILEQSLPGFTPQDNRRRAWSSYLKTHPEGVVLLLDEVSEFLRSKPTPAAFNEDIRFLQFLGELSQEHPLWIVAALQEQIEHTGAIEHDLYRKIKDRFPHRYLLTSAHVRDVITKNILRRKEGFEKACDALADDLAEVLPEGQAALLKTVYPLHPATLDILEEVRDRFSQSRGVIDFVLTRLLGDEAKGVKPFLDEPWGQVLCPDAVVDHFADVFEIQPEFQPLAQKVFPELRRRMPGLFEKPAQRDLAWRAVKCLVLAHLSPRRGGLSLATVTQWLLPRASTLDPARDQEIVKTLLEKLVQEGAYLRRQDQIYRLDLADDSAAEFDRLLQRTVSELKNRGEPPFHLLPEALAGSDFNPFEIPLHRWQRRRVRWHWHERELSVYLGGGTPAHAPETEPALHIALPWGPAPAGSGHFRVVPQPIDASDELLELAALAQILDRPLSEAVKQRARERFTARRMWAHALLRSSYSAADVMTPQGQKTRLPLDPRQTNFTAWLQSLGEFALRHTYPLFEKFAPAAGPLPRESLRQFVTFATHSDLTSPDAPEAVRMIREAYLMPLGLMERKGVMLSVHPRLDQHELVKLILPILDRHPAPARIYETLSAPLYGLTPDQIHLLLVFLLVHGEIDIVKGSVSYRESFDTLPYPLNYDRLLPGQALSAPQLQGLETLATAFNLRPPKHWTVLAQRHTLQRTRDLGRQSTEKLGRFLHALGEPPQAPDLAERLRRLLGLWALFLDVEDVLDSFGKFFSAVGPLPAFLAEHKELESLPERYERLARDTQRYRHLLGYPCLARCADPAVAAQVHQLGTAPSLADPEAVEAWLARARAVYDSYRAWYRLRHEEFWRELQCHEVWPYRPPTAFNCREAGLKEMLEETLRLRSAVVEKRCGGLSELEFQPLCRCGFDGRNAPVTEALQAFETALRRVEKEAMAFFQQAEVKERLRTWLEQNWEDPKGVRDFLEGRAPWPHMDNLTLFDQHMAGLELTKTVAGTEWLASLGRGPWQEKDFLREVARLFERNGPRVFLETASATVPQEAALWCVERALAETIPLPPGWPPGEWDSWAQNLTPAKISPHALARLDDLRLPTPVVRRLLGLLFAGDIPAPDPVPNAGSVRALLDIKTSPAPLETDPWGQRLRNLYHHRPLLETLQPDFCRRRLEEWASLDPVTPPPALAAVWEAESPATQRVVVDALGLLFVAMAREVLEKVLAPTWVLDSLSYALGPTPANTDAFYKTLAEKPGQPFEKFNALDRLIHDRELSWADLEKLARAELEIQAQQLKKNLDPARPLLWLGDHGFRPTADGRRWVHGGPTSLERVVPVFRFRPGLT